ncbi:serine hydrolase domain-containing protein [Phenylobacterium montanum]|uniref:Beta-lactamase family protein n=1 Tax=Phenylobacterium montanum TaxID=2823693 RepID=A0A975IVH1_9CAUL|nr:serine hydrolase domain-containing protein [Caulobacter sp. S6]QUD87316.1 beta-lactamase family protein [Caulobacter sp. S6]
MSRDRTVEAMLDELVAAGELAGAVTLAWRAGRIVQSAAVGWRDIAGGLPMERDTLFRIASLSKPVTSVVALTLLEEGRFALDEPISRWAPEFADMRVLNDPEGPLDATRPANRPITFEDLLTHRAGLTYGDFHTGPLARAYAEALGGDIDSHASPGDWIAGLAALPLIDQPGAGFHYGCSTDLLGLLLARMDDAPLDEVMRRRLFRPLGMTDTGFDVPREQRPRRARMYGFDSSGRLAERTSGPGGSFMAERPESMTFQSGGQGLWSTADDYLAFARLFLGAGAVDGVRILKPETMALMTANRLSEAQRASARLLGMPLFAGHGFGLGVAVVLDPDNASAVRCKGAIGTVGWPGAFGGWWQADPIDQSAMVFLAHNALELEQLAEGIGLGVYAAITEFHAAVSAPASALDPHSPADAEGLTAPGRR